MITTPAYKTIDRKTSTQIITTTDPSETDNDLFSTISPTVETSDSLNLLSEIAESNTEPSLSDVAPTDIFNAPTKAENSLNSLVQFNELFVSDVTATERPLLSNSGIAFGNSNKLSNDITQSTVFAPRPFARGSTTKRAETQETSTRRNVGKVSSSSLRTRTTTKSNRIYSTESPIDDEEDEVSIDRSKFRYDIVQRLGANRGNNRYRRPTTKLPRKDNASLNSPGSRREFDSTTASSSGEEQLINENRLRSLNFNNRLQNTQLFTRRTTSEPLTNGVTVSNSGDSKIIEPSAQNIRIGDDGRPDRLRFSLSVGKKLDFGVATKGPQSKNDVDEKRSKSDKPIIRIQTGPLTKSPLHKQGNVEELPLLRASTESAEGIDKAVNITSHSDKLNFNQIPLSQIDLDSFQKLPVDVDANEINELDSTTNWQEETTISIGEFLAEDQVLETTPASVTLRRRPSIISRPTQPIRTTEDIAQTLDLKIRPQSTRPSRFRAETELEEQNADNVDTIKSNFRPRVRPEINRAQQPTENSRVQRPSKFRSRTQSPNEEDKIVEESPTQARTRPTLSRGRYQSTTENSNDLTNEDQSSSTRGRIRPNLLRTRNQYTTPSSSAESLDEDAQSKTTIRSRVRPSLFRNRFEASTPSSSDESTDADDQDDVESSTTQTRTRPSLYRSRQESTVDSSAEVTTIDDKLDIETTSAAPRAFKPRLRPSLKGNKAREQTLTDSTKDSGEEDFLDASRESTENKVRVNKPQRKEPPTRVNYLNRFKVTVSSNEEEEIEVITGSPNLDENENEGGETTEEIPSSSVSTESPLKRVRPLIVVPGSRPNQFKTTESSDNGKTRFPTRKSYASKDRFTISDDEETAVSSQNDLSPPPNRFSFSRRPISRSRFTTLKPTSEAALNNFSLEGQDEDSIVSETTERIQYTFPTKQGISKSAEDDENTSEISSSSTRPLNRKRLKFVKKRLPDKVEEATPESINSTPNENPINRRTKVFRRPISSSVTPAESSTASSDSSSPATLQRRVVVRRLNKTTIPEETVTRSNSDPLLQTSTVSSLSDAIRRRPYRIIKTLKKNSTLTTEDPSSTSSTEGTALTRKNYSRYLIPSRSPLNSLLKKETPKPANEQSVEPANEDNFDSSENGSDEDQNEHDENEDNEESNDNQNENQDENSQEGSDEELEEESPKPLAKYPTRPSISTKRVTIRRRLPALTGRTSTIHPASTRFVSKTLLTTKYSKTRVTRRKYNPSRQTTEKTETIDLLEGFDKDARLVKNKNIFKNNRKTTTTAATVAPINTFTPIQQDTDNSLFTTTEITDDDHTKIIDLENSDVLQEDEKSKFTTTVKPTTLHHKFAIVQDSDDKKNENGKPESSAEEIIHKLEKLVEINRIVEIYSKEEKRRLLKNKKFKKYNATDLVLEQSPTLGKFGEVSRLTLVKLVKPENITTERTTTVDSRTPRNLVFAETVFAVESSTIPLEGLFDKDKKTDSAYSANSLDSSDESTETTDEVPETTTYSPFENYPKTFNKTSVVRAISPLLRPESNETDPLVISIANLDQVILSKVRDEADRKAAQSKPSKSENSVITSQDGVLAGSGKVNVVVDISKEKVEANDELLVSTTDRSMDDTVE